MTIKKTDSPFAQLEALRDKLPEGTRPMANPTTAVAPKGPARAVVRMERKQRGGKEVTVIEKLALPTATLEQWCRELKHALGCGGSVEGATIVLQGDLRSRLERLLQDRGVGRITIG